MLSATVTTIPRPVRSATLTALDQLVRFRIKQNVTNLWVMRQMSQMLVECGFEPSRRRGHSYVAEGDATYFLTVIDRGADLLAVRGMLRAQTVAALKTRVRFSGSCPTSAR